MTLPAALPEPFHWADPPTGPLTIASLDEVGLAIDYIPTTPGSHSASFTITSNDPARRRVTVQLQGDSPAGDPIRFEPAVVQMDDQPLFGSQGKVLRVVNVSGVPHSLRVLEPVPTSKLGDEWSRAYDFADESLPAGGVMEIEVGFHPLEPGDRSTTMTIQEYREGQTVEYQVQLRGRCVLPSKKGGAASRRKPPARARRGK